MLLGTITKLSLTSVAKLAFCLQSSRSQASVRKHNVSSLAPYKVVGGARRSVINHMIFTVTSRESHTQRCHRNVTNKLKYVHHVVDHSVNCCSVVSETVQLWVVEHPSQLAWWTLTSPSRTTQEGKQHGNYMINGTCDCTKQQSIR